MQDFGGAPQQRRVIGHPRRRVIDPVGMDVEIDIAGFLRLLQLLGPAARLRALVFGRPQRDVAQRQQQIVAQGAGEQIRRSADIADAPADHGDGGRGEVEAADRDPPAGRPHQAGEQQRQLVLAAAALPDDREMLVERCGEADRVDDAAAVFFGERQIGDDDLAGERRHALRASSRQARIHQTGWLKLLDDLVVFDPRILEALVEIEQFLPWRRQILVGRKHRHQRPERKTAPDHQITADREKEERGQLAYEVVQELDEEFALIDLKADVVDSAQERGETAQLQFGGIVGEDFGDPAADSCTRSATWRTVRTRSRLSWLTLRCNFGMT